MKKAKTWDFTHSLPRPPNASSVSRPAFPPFLNLPSLFGWLVCVPSYCSHGRHVRFPLVKP